MVTVQLQLYCYITYIYNNFVKYHQEDHRGTLFPCQVMHLLKDLLVLHKLCYKYS